MIVAEIVTLDDLLNSILVVKEKLENDGKSLKNIKVGFDNGDFYQTHYGTYFVFDESSNNLNTLIFEV